jgi:putative ABC transport system permease protein
MTTIIQDLRYGLRVLAGSPGFTAVAVLTLALGIGANTAIFSVINAVLLRPLRYRDPGRLVSVTEFYPNFNRSMVFVPEYAAWQKYNKVFDQIAAFTVNRGINMAGGERPERVLAGHVTARFFSVLGIQAALGRTFLPEEDQPGHNVVVLSDALWRRYFASDPGVLGRSIPLDGTSYEVVGVMPAGFVQPDDARVALWLAEGLPPGSDRPASSMRIVHVIARLKPGATLKDAQAELEVIDRRTDGQYPPPWSTYHAAARVRIATVHDALTHDTRPALLILLGAVALILLIACANIAGFLLARAVSREKEIAVRAALGAGRLRLVRQMVTESTLLAVAGGACGLLLASWGKSVLQSLIPETISAQPDIDLRVLAFTLVFSVATGILFGLVPALAASKLHLTESLKEGGAQQGETKVRARLRSTFVVSQFAMTLVLLVGAGLLIRSLVLVLKVSPGFDPHNVLTGEVWLEPESTYDPPRQAAFFRQVLERIQALPGVQYAAATTELPMTMFNGLGNGLAVEGEPETDVDFSFGSVTPDYFRALGIRLLEGRFFDDRDAEGAPSVVIISQSLARSLFQGRDALGKRIKFGERWRTLVGVVADSRHQEPSERVLPELFQPYLQAPSPFMALVVRTRSDPARFAPLLAGTVRALDKNEPLADVATMEQRLADSVAGRRETALLLGIFAAVALAIAVTGIYGLMSYSVTRRTHEIGIRIALGARREDILNMVVGQGLGLTLLGVGIGLGGAVAVSRVFARFLYGVTPTDPSTFVGVSLLLIAIGLLATYLPARRAMKVDPIVALRHE